MRSSLDAWWCLARCSHLLSAPLNLFGFHGCRNARNVNKNLENEVCQRKTKNLSEKVETFEVEEDGYGGRMKGR